MAKITQEELKEIIEAHGKWYWSNGKEGERANLARASLDGASLCGANLCGASLDGASLCGANLDGASLARANLCGANLARASLDGANLARASLCGANLARASLCGANLYGASLAGANLCGANLDKTYYQITRIGSRNGITTYCLEDDNVRCGCWNSYKGGTLAEFKERVESVYGVDGKTPNKKYYAQYMAAIEFFEAMKKLKESE